MKLGSYDTAANEWTLTAWRLGDAPQKTNLVERPGGDGSWDLSTSLTDGVLRYGDRTLTATFECSEGDRLYREAKIRQMVNQLDGMEVNIELPDDPDHYLVGRLKVVKEYNDMAHGSVSLTATCRPWKYSYRETVTTLTATTTEKTARLVNNGRRAVVPVLTVTGASASVRIVYGVKSLSITAGTHQWPDLILTPGTHDIKYSGTGSLAITYREAILE
jgi:phage-related protein